MNNEEIDLKSIYDHQIIIDSNMKVVTQFLNDVNRFLPQVSSELEMQRRVLVGLKIQRNIDRRNRLRLLKRLNKEKQKNKQNLLILKMAIGCTLMAILFHK